MVTSLFLLLIAAAVVYGIINALTGAAGGSEADGLPDTAETLKSFAIHAGLFLAFVAVAVGTIDLIQALVEERDRLAGTNSDVARGLSLLIVGAPVFGLLLVLVDRRSKSRAASGGTAPLRGWSVYLVATLSTALTASLVSITQILWDVIAERASFDAAELAQLLVWMAAWGVHWFVLLPRFGVRGGVHLAYGTIVGLGWLVGGVAGASFSVLEAAYDSVFRDRIAGDSDPLFWLAIGIVGLIAWWWHWIQHLNTRGSAWHLSSAWFFTAVVGGVLPAILTIIFTATAMISGVLVWLLGTHDQGAVDFFAPAPGFVVAMVLGLVTWAYYRWELDRDGSTERNESLRFHDYLVTSVGLIGVVAATSFLVTLLIDSIVYRQYLASGTNDDNALIVTITVLVLAAALWWWQWSRIEGHRARHPLAESDSRWRKLYLVAGFGAGGLVLASSTIWVLFAALRDLLDGALSTSTVDDLKGPVGWAVAVIGAVWYHLGVWRSDGRTLAAAAPAPAPMPPPPTAASAEPASPAGSTLDASTPDSAELRFRYATDEDHGELFTLQRAAFVDEAVVYRTVEVPALQESFAQFTARLSASQTIVAFTGGRIVGSVSVRQWRDGGSDIERLMVAPDMRREGIASLLLAAVEDQLRAQDQTEVQLIVGEAVAEARALYELHGYATVERSEEPDGVGLLTMRKALERTSG